MYVRDGILPGRIIMIKPMMKPVTNVAPPMSCVYINSVSLLEICERDVKMSGEPFPKARRVTPAKFSLKPRRFEMTASAGQKLKI